MVNFQNVLSQKGHDYGPLWCDEAVYRIAKELQLQNPVQLSNIFLGIGGFHLEKNLLACCVVYLEGTGVENILVENEIFGPVSVKSAISGGDYIRGKHAMSIFADVLERLQFQMFLESLEQSRQIGTSSKKIQDVFQKGGSIEQKEREKERERLTFAWGECKCFQPFENKEETVVNNFFTGRNF